MFFLKILSLFLKDVMCFFERCYMLFLIATCPLIKGR